MLYNASHDGKTVTTAASYFIFPNNDHIIEYYYLI